MKKAIILFILPVFFSGCCYISHIACKDFITYDKDLCLQTVGSNGFENKYKTEKTVYIDTIVDVRKNEIANQIGYYDLPICPHDCKLSMFNTIIKNSISSSMSLSGIKTTNTVADAKYILRGELVAYFLHFSSSVTSISTPTYNQTDIKYGISNKPLVISFKLIDAKTNETVWNKIKISTVSEKDLTHWAYWQSAYVYMEKGTQNYIDNMALELLKDSDFIKTISN